MGGRGRLSRCCSAAGALFAGGGPDAPAALRKPNIVLITTDDQTLASLSVMKRVRRLLVDRGATFSDDDRVVPALLPVAGDLDHRASTPTTTG